MSTWFYDLPSTMLRRNPYISAKNTDRHASDGKGLEIFNLVDLFYNAGFTLEDGSFAVPSMSIVFMKMRMLIGEKKAMAKRAFSP